MRLGESCGECGCVRCFGGEGGEVGGRGRGYGGEVGLAVGEREVVLSEEEGTGLESGGIGIIPREGVIGSEAELIELVLIEFEFGGGFGDLAF